MKKINVILLIFSFVLSGIGGIFLFGANAFQQSTISCNAPVEEIMEYTYKTFNAYFVDYAFSNITLSGEGTAEKPFQVNSTEDFLWLLKGNEFTSNMILEKRGVPSAYEEVAYLQSTGTQIFDTGVVVKNSIKPYIKFKTSGTYNSNGSGRNLFGGTDNSKPISVAVNFGEGNVTSIFPWHGTTYGIQVT